MQTNLCDSARQRAEAAEAERILRSCVHCGFCNATCPTYQELGDELDGPRGRIYLIKQFLERDRAKAALACNLGPLALQYIMQNGGSGYFRTRVVSSYLDGGTLQRVEQAPEFAYPTYLVYSRERLSPTLRHAFQLLREVVREDSDWSQRWDYVI